MLGNLISAGATLIGGLLGKSSADKANKSNIQQQREFAQNSVQWRVADAQKAGVSPLVALGMSPMSFSPSTVGDTSLPSALSGMGQDIGRAVSSKVGPQGRYDAAIQALTLRRAELENDLLASQIAKINAPGNPPGIAGVTAVPGQGDVPVLEHPDGGKMLLVGPGASAQDLEDQYGDVGPEIENIYRYTRDRLWPMFWHPIRDYLSPEAIEGRVKRNMR